MPIDHVKPWREWLRWLDSHDGRLYRRRQGGDETDWDFAALLPTPGGGQTIVTVGDLRRLVAQAEIQE